MFLGDLRATGARRRLTLRDADDSDRVVKHVAFRITVSLLPNVKQLRPAVFKHVIQLLGKPLFLTRATPMPFTADRTRCADMRMDSHHSSDAFVVQG
jgi:hypothetical protein